MSQELARKRPATILLMQPLSQELEVRTVQPLERGPAPKVRRPDLWPWYVWAPILCAPGAVMAFVLVYLAGFIVHTL